VSQAKPVLTLKRPRRGAKHSAANGKKAERKVELAPPTRSVSDAELLTELQAVAPDLWNPENPVPLAIGIHKQLYPIAERMQVSRRSLRGFLARWTASRSYQRALGEPGARRFNLDGSPAGEVTRQHGDSARERVAPH